MGSVVFIMLLLFSVASATTSWDSRLPVSDPIAFVRSIELAEPRFSIPNELRNRTRAKLGTPPDHKKEGYVVGGAITAFTESVTGISKQDILDSTLFAQLAADRKYDREKDTVDWYSYYKYILGNIGFVIESFNFNEYQSKGNSFSMDKVVVEILASIATGDSVAITAAVLDAMRGMADSDNRITLFSQQSATTTSGNFQIYPCEQASTGEVSMALGAFYFKASSHKTNFLFFSYGSSSTHFYKGAQKTVLNQKIYAQVRSDVSAKLGNNAVNLVASIEL